MKCRKCGYVYDEKENVFCPSCGEASENDEANTGILNTGVYNNMINNNAAAYNREANKGQFVQNNGINSQPSVSVPATQYMQYAGKYYPGLSKKNLFSLQWLKKYNTAIMVLSIIMYVLEGLMIASVIIVLTSVVGRAQSLYRYNGYYLRDYSTLTLIFAIIMVIFVILLMLTILAHVKKSRVASGFLMGFYILSIIGQIINISDNDSAAGILMTIIFLGLSIAIFVLNIVYNSKWNLYTNTGIIPGR